jgi:protein-arginine kinase activator protein McsA
MLRNWHAGATRHVGRLPRGRLEIETTVSERLLHLRREQQQAIKNEDYETAGRIRDEIQTIERGSRAGEVGEEGAGGSTAWADPVHP